MIRTIALSAACVAMTGCMLPKHRAERLVQEQIETSPLEMVDLSTFNGTVTIKTHDKPVVDMDIKYVARGETPEAAQAAVELMTTEISAENGVLTMAAQKPSGQWSASAGYTLTVPKNVDLKLRTSNGTIDISGTAGEVDVTTSNGKILLADIIGSISASTSNGSIKAKNCDGAIKFRTSNGSVAWEGPFYGADNEIRTSNGALSIKLPQDFAAEVVASTSNGSIRCDCPVAETIESKKRSLHIITPGPITAGSSSDAPAKLTLRTSNGSVKIGVQETQVESQTESDMSPEITPSSASGGIAL